MNKPWKYRQLYVLLLLDVMDLYNLSNCRSINVFQIYDFVLKNQNIGMPAMMISLQSDDPTRYLISWNSYSTVYS